MGDEADRICIHEVINLHGHVMDDGAFERLGELFTEDVVYDVSALGGSVLNGHQAVADAAFAMGERNPLAHHVTNVVVAELGDESSRARSKGLAVMANGTTGSVVYDDELRRTAEGWRIAVRRILPRSEPLTPS